LKTPVAPAAAVICLCAWLNCTGWTLSALHQLNVVGYTVSLLLGVAAFWWWKRRTALEIFPRRTTSVICRRFRLPLPAFFSFLTVLIFLGGVLYAPSNYDALTYRLPRMLNWMTTGQWSWIPTFNERMNYSGVAWEWTALPLLVLTHSDRGMFLINALGFVLLPGLLFSIFRQLGVARKVAWTWMWLLPLAYGFVTQAGSIGNDLTGVVFCLLAVHFGLSARRSDRVRDVWLAVLATALMTGVKVSNLPLALPCLVAMWPALGLLRKHFIGSLAVAVIAVVISALPIMALNQLHTGSWNGDPQNKYGMQIKNPAAAVLGNGILLAEQSFMPPVLPGSRQVNHWIIQALPDSLKTAFPRLLLNTFNELPGEEGAGLGLGITLPLLLVLGISIYRFRHWGSLKDVFSLLPPVALTAWVSALFFLAKIGSEAGPRLLLPYYLPVMIPFLLLPAQLELLRLRAWRIFLFLAALSVLPVMVLSMSRPLWPAQSITTRLALTHPGNPTLQRLATTCTVYAHRNDLLAPIRSALPDSAREIGFIAGSNDTDYSLWRPFGQRKVRYLRPDIRRFLQNPDLEWVVVKQNIWPEISPVSLETWAAAHHATIVATMPIVEIVSWGPENWCVLHFENQSGQTVAPATRLSAAMF
jgi:hypothetical protein